MYSRESVEQLELRHSELQMQLLDVAGATITAAGAYRNTTPLVFDHLTYGVARRIRVICHAMSRTYELFPPDATQRLADKDLADVTLCLHAFLLNIAAIFDNWAWAYVLRHGVVLDKMKVGLFLKTTQQILPAPVRDYLTSKRISEWHAESVKPHRDATAHRIPPYLPPSWLTPDQVAKATALSNAWNEHLRQRDHNSAFAAMDQLTNLGGPAFAFYHAPADEAGRHVPIHQQMLCDAGVLMEFSPIFLANWGQPPPP